MQDATDRKLLWLCDVGSGAIEVIRLDNKPFSYNDSRTISGGIKQAHSKLLRMIIIALGTESRGANQ